MTSYQGTIIDVIQGRANENYRVLHPELAVKKIDDNRGKGQGKNNRDCDQSTDKSVNVICTSK